MGYFLFKKSFGFGSAVLSFSTVAITLTLLFLSADHVAYTYPDDYFISPVDNSLLLSGTFGELRNNHFHSGIDIKAKGGRTGEPIRAAAAGHVSRIKVEPGGYGQVLYIDHPNGFTTVYAHLESFFPEVADFVKAAQYERQTFELDLRPVAGTFKVEQGQTIGTLGMTGTTFGPHLHFEIRDTRTASAINPLHFGFDVADQIPPFMNQLKVYEFNEQGHEIDATMFDLKKAGKDYRIVEGDTLEIGRPYAGFGIKTYDRQSHTYNWNGVYRISLYKDSALLYRYQMDAFRIEDTRYLNAHIDYAEQVAHNSYVNRCFILPGNQLKAYITNESNGLVALSGGKLLHIKIVAEDIEGNMTTLSFWVKQVVTSTNKERYTFDYFLPFDEGSIVEDEGLSVHFPEGCLYENLHFNYTSAFEHSTDIYSKVYHLHNLYTPVHTYYHLSIKPEGLPSEKRERAFIAYCNGKNQILNSGGTWNAEGWLTAEVRDLGDFSIMVDEEPPTIIPLHFSTDMSRYSEMKFKVEDNFKVTGKGKDLSFEGKMDHQWVLVEYDRKNKELTHTFEKNLERGRHTFELKVVDALGNEAFFAAEFVR